MILKWYEWYCCAAKREGRRDTWGTSRALLQKIVVGTAHCSRKKGPDGVTAASGFAEHSSRTCTGVARSFCVFVYSQGRLYALSN